jgi:hypothetical protein
LSAEIAHVSVGEDHLSGAQGAGEDVHRRPGAEAPEPGADRDVATREIAHEQEFVDRVYRQLEQSARNAEALAKEGHGRGRLGHEGGLVERDAMVFQAGRRIAALNAAHEGLVFGRLDLRDGSEGPRYIGRIGLRDENRDSLLVDWRAPAAAVFYQATASAPQGVVRRRVLRCAGAKVTAVEDDLLDPDAPQADRVPAVLRPAPLRVRRGAGGRPVGRVHALHRAGAAVAG